MTNHTNAGHQSGPRSFKPALSELLRSLRLDVEYERGRGSYLYYRDERGKEVKVLDLVGGYGALLLGHCHPELVAEAQRLLTCERPMHVQGSVRRYAMELADELVRRTGTEYCVTFANSGAEAVEAAMKHAILETGSNTFLALEGGFHGKTLGALQLTANEQYREPFTFLRLPVVRVQLNDIDRLEAAFASTEGIAGLFLEPIQGEGGVRPVDPRFAQAAAELCRSRGVPLIADECQTGLGRTGRFLASEALGITPDYVLLSKVLGGGMAKISALLIRQERYVDAFDLKHTSTFADDDYSCALALKTLRMIDDSLLARCRRQGERLLSGLRRLQERYPDVVADVRGRGLMIGIEFRPPMRSESFILRLVSAQKDLGFIIAGYLLNAHRIRIAPTLSDPFTLRAEPPALIDDEEIERVVAAMEDVCARIHHGDALGLTGYLASTARAAGRTTLTPRSGDGVFAFDDLRLRRSQGDMPSTRVAWLCHLVDADDLVKLEPHFARLSCAQREQYLDRLVARAAPVVLSAVNIRSLTGQQIRLYPILLPFTSRWVKRLIETRQFATARAFVQKGLDVAHALGCDVVSLGQYTSIVTRNATQLTSHGMGITSGNSYPAALALQAVERAQKERGQDPADSTLAIVGAAGNVGSICARLLASHYRRLILVGSKGCGSRARLEKLTTEIPNAEWSVDLSAIRCGDVVIASTSAVEALLGPEHFRENAVICDLSVPAALRSVTSVRRPDLLVIEGGIVRLPFGEDLEIIGFPLGPGRTYGCMAEGMLLGFEGVRNGVFTGALTAGHIARIQAIADRHGFALHYQTGVEEPRRSELVGR